jgi:alpha-methylacyl-CoA racemase
LKALFLTKIRDERCNLLDGTDVCFRSVLSFSDAARHPHNVARDTFLDINGVARPAPAPKFNHSEPYAGVLPKSGEHADDILKSICFNDLQIALLKKRVMI